MDLLENLQRAAQRQNVEFLVIGGHAVNFHGYSRGTFDLDLLIPRGTAATWKNIISDLGYAVIAEAGNFIQFSPSSRKFWPLDLMIVNEGTFQKMFTASIKGSVQGATVHLPTLNHLIALKLHVLKQSLLHRFSKDLEDVVILMEVNKIDVFSDDFKHLCERYGNMSVYEQIAQITKSRH